jgi:hypothetical protein
MNKYLFIAFFSLSGFLLHSQSLNDMIFDYYVEGNLWENGSLVKQSIRLTNETISIFDALYSQEMETYSVQWSSENKNDYITFNYTGKNLGPKISHGIKKYIVLFRRPLYSSSYTSHPAGIALYDNNNELVTFRIWQYHSKFDMAIEATSELQERNIIYGVNNLRNISNLTPWAEGVLGDGIGEKFIGTALRQAGYPEYTPDLSWYYHFELVISNGFVDYNRPYLYEYNNRVKSLKIYITDDDGKILDELFLDIEDVIGFQSFDLHFWEAYDYVKVEKIKNSNIIIEIQDVYPGSCYNDTCINYMELFYGK